MNSRLLLLALACAGLMPLGARAAATVLIWPIDPYLPPGQNAAELWLENRGASAAVMQVRVVRWQQENGFERYSAQQDVVASPPMLSLGAGDKQLIRLIKQGSVPAGKEYAYRIVIDEIPDAAAAQEGLRLQMRYSVPLFAYGEGVPLKENASSHAQAEPGNLSWRTVRDGGQPALEVQNRGSVHLRLSQVSVHERGASRTLADGLLGYVLPGQSRRWPLPPGVSHPDSMTATINAQDAKWQSRAVN